MSAHSSASRSTSANFIDDQFFELALLLLRQFSWSPSGRALCAIVIRIGSVGNDGIDGLHFSLLAIIFEASLSDVLSRGTSFSLSDNPAPLECAEASKRLDHVSLAKDDAKHNSQ